MGHTLAVTAIRSSDYGATFEATTVTDDALERVNRHLSRLSRLSSKKRQW